MIKRQGVLVMIQMIHIWWYLWVTLLFVYQARGVIPYFIKLKLITNKKRNKRKGKVKINHLNRWDRFKIFFREVNSYIFILMVWIILYYEYLVLTRQSYLVYLQTKIFIKRCEGRSWRYLRLWNSLNTYLYQIEVIWFLKVSLRLYHTSLFIEK